MDVKVGKCDLYVNSYDEETDTEGIGARLPKSKRNAVWYIEDVSPITSLN